MTLEFVVRFPALSAFRISIPIDGSIRVAARPRTTAADFKDAAQPIWLSIFKGVATMFKGAAIAGLLLIGADRFINGGQVTDAVLAMLRHIAHAFGL